MLVDSDKDICFELLRKQQNREKMKAAIMKVTGRSYSLGRYSYPDEKKTDDALSQLANDLKAAGIPVSGQ